MIAVSLLCAGAAGCSDDDPDPDPGDSSIECGAGTELVDGVCRPVVEGDDDDGDGDDDSLTCGEGTTEVDGECVPSRFEPGHFLSPLVQMQSLAEVGSHTDEVRIREDNLLLNCSYTFNVIDAVQADDMERTHAEGLVHTIPGDTRQPGCKHLAWDGNLVFTTHLGNIRNPAFLSGWDISDPANPIQLPVLQELGTSYEGVDVANHVIFVGLHENGLGAYTFDGTNGFTRVGSLGGFTNAWGIAARDNRVFVADGLGGFAIVDATDPAALVELGRVATGGQARGVVVDGDVAYVAAGSAGVVVVDVADPASPQVLGRAAMPGTALRVAFSEGHLFVAAWNDVRVYDVSNPATPRLVAAVRVPRNYDYEDIDRELPTMRTFGVAARGRDVFIGTWENPYSYRFVPDRLAPNIRLPEMAARVDFGAVAVGESKTVLLDVTNQGTAPLTLVDMWNTNSAFQVNPRQARIEPGKTIALELTYKATAETQEVSYFHIDSDDPAAPTRKAYLVGNSPGLTVGAPLPETAGTMLDGTQWSSATDAAGKVLLLSYFATFCPVCANHLPDVQERFYGQYADRGLQVVGLNPRELTDQVGQVSQYAETIQVTFPLGIEEGSPTYRAVTANFVGPNPFPVDVIVDKQGIIRYASHEYDPDTMQAIIEQLLAE